MQEEDVGEAGSDLEGAEAKYDTNKDYIVDAARVMAATGSETPNLQEGYYSWSAGMCKSSIPRLRDPATWLRGAISHNPEIKWIGFLKLCTLG